LRSRGERGSVRRDGVRPAGETIDHVAFRLNDHEGMQRKLDRLSITYSPMDLPELGEWHLFIRMRTAILPEHVFRDRSAESVASTSQEQDHAE
jgi:hypothetical protein